MFGDLICLLEMGRGIGDGGENWSGDEGIAVVGFEILFGKSKFKLAGVEFERGDRGEIFGDGGGDNGAFSGVWGD